MTKVFWIPWCFSCVKQFLHARLCLDNLSLSHVWMAVLVVLEQLIIFSCVWIAFLLSHVWMMMLVVFEQNFVFSCVWTTFLLSHVWMTMLVVFEQLFMFTCVWTTFLLTHVWMTMLRCTHDLKSCYCSIFRLTIYFFCLFMLEWWSW